MSRKYEVTAVTGKYTDNNGQERSRYQTIGAVIETKNGPMLKLESVPIGWDGWAYLNEPKPREDQPQRQGNSQGNGQQRRTSAPRQAGGYEDDGADIPF